MSDAEIPDGVNERVATWSVDELDAQGRELEVVTAPASVLSTVGEKVDPTSPEIVQLAADLVATMRVSPGCVGLAAPQVGESVKVFSGYTAIDLRDEEQPTSNRERHNHILAFDAADPDTGEVVAERGTEITDKLRKKLLDAGISLQNIRTAISTLRDRGVGDLAQITLMSDGTTVYECTSTDEVVDLLQGGQAVFAIAVGRHVRDVEGTLAALPGERATGAERDTGAASAADELTHRRRRRTTA